MTIKLLISEDIKSLEEYLNPYRAECMYICGGLREAGIEYKGEPSQGEYFGYFDEAGRLNGVMVHVTKGNIMMYSKDAVVLRELANHIKANSTRPICGFLGPKEQVEVTIEAMDLQDAACAVNRDEDLYSIDLAKIKHTPDLAAGATIVRGADAPMESTLEQIQDYYVEVFGASKDDQLRQRAKQSVDGLIHESWALLLDNQLVSLSVCSARLEDIVQIGPLSTVSQHRNKGLAKSLLHHTLMDEASKGTRQAIFATNNPAAARVCEAVGFTKIGVSKLALLKDFWHRKN